MLLFNGLPLESSAFLALRTIRERQGDTSYRRGILTAESTFRAALTMSSALGSIELGGVFSLELLVAVLCLLADVRGAISLLTREVPALMIVLFG